MNSVENTRQFSPTLPHSERYYWPMQKSAAADRRTDLPTVPHLRFASAPYTNKQKRIARIQMLNRISWPVIELVQGSEAGLPPDSVLSWFYRWL
jgi:hypothetical protein